MSHFLSSSSFPSLASLLALSTLSTLALPSTAPAAELSIGMVEFQKIQRHYYRTEAERRALEERRNAEVAKLEDSAAKAREEIESLLLEQNEAQTSLGDPTLSDEKKQEILAAAQSRAERINALQRAALEEQAGARNLLAREVDQANAALLEEINDAIRITAEERGVDFVMNRSFGVGGIPTFPYASARNVIDLTDEVIGKLNRNAPEGWEPSESEGSEKAGD